MRISVAQLNPIVGDIAGNTAQILEAMAEAASQDLLICPEMSLTGYPPKDLLEYPGFLAQVDQHLETLVQKSAAFPGLTTIVGAPVAHINPGIGLYNAAYLICNGQCIGAQPKQLLPTYDVFDERRYFDSGDQTHLFEIAGSRVGIAICEDAWSSEQGEKRGYQDDPLVQLSNAGAEHIVLLMASPYELGKDTLRVSMLQSRAKELSLPITFVNQVGGIDDLIFDGGSAAISSTGEVIAAAPSFQSGVYDFSIQTDLDVVDDMAKLYQALCLGVHDYVSKSGFSNVLLGLSGGIDSALVATIAADALGPEAVLGVALPSPYSSEGSVTDAEKLAGNLGIALRQLPIQSVFEASCSALDTVFTEPMKGITEENLQARLRGNLLMALSNQENRLLLTTGNKSELAVGYCTLYGDMNGGFAPISDLPKTVVYELARWINRNETRIPTDSITKPPSAELRPDQTDQDSLPSYDILDAILDGYIVKKQSLSDLVNQGYDPEIVDWVLKQVNRNEYKRHQAAPGIKVTSKAFGSGRKMVLSARFSF